MNSLLSNNFTISYSGKDTLSKALSGLLNSAALLQNSLISNLQKTFLSYEKQISKLYNKTSKIRSALASLILNSVFPNSKEEKLIKKIQEPNYDPMMSVKDFVLYSENYININKIKELESHVKSLQEDIDKICIEKINLIEKAYNLEQEKKLYKKNYEISGNAVMVLKKKCQKFAEMFGVPDDFFDCEAPEAIHVIEPGHRQLSKYSLLDYTVSTVGVDNACFPYDCGYSLVSDNEICIIGGHEQGYFNRFLNYSENCYLLNTTTYNLTPFLMHIPRSNTGQSTTHHNEIFIFGGTQNGQDLKLSHKYSTKSSTWLKLPDFPIPISSTSSSLLKNQIYISSKSCEYIYMFDTIEHKYKHSRKIVSGMNKILISAFKNVFVICGKTLLRNKKKDPCNYVVIGYIPDINNEPCVGYPVRRNQYVYFVVGKNMFRLSLKSNRVKNLEG